MILNALTVDVEDYFHVSAFSDVVSSSEWDSYEPRIERNTSHLLDIFDEHKVKATFFVLGWVAERHPQLVREISGRRHEVACHGMTHELVYNQTPEVFRQQTLRAKSLLEDVIQNRVVGYRAASFSVTNGSHWALDILAELDFQYDSSIFPIKHDRYGAPDAVTQPHRLSTPAGLSIVEFPLTTATFLGVRLPVGGGGYFRLYPYAVTRWNLTRINRAQQPFVFYLHPWEIDPDQPRIEAGWLSTFRHYNNLEKCEGRLRRLLADFRFATIRDVLAQLGLLTTP